MNRTVRFAVVLGLGLMILMQATAQGNQVADIDEKPIVADGLAVLAEWYAEHYGVPVEEATRRLLLEPDAGTLKVRLQTEVPDLFGGIVIEHEPEFRFVVRMKPGGEDVVRRYTDDLSAASIIDVITAKYSLRELVEHQNHAVEIAHSLGVNAAAGGHIAEQLIDLYVTDAEELELRLSDAGRALPETVRVVQVETLETTEDLLGGFPLSVCTSGFTGIKWINKAQGTYEKGIFTSGHCDNTISFQGQPFTSTVEHWGGCCDFQFHRNTTSHALRNMINNGATWVPITGLLWMDGSGSASTAPGMVMCKFGKVTGFACGNVYWEYYNPGIVSGRTFSDTFVWVSLDSGNLSSPGDSGGPWYRANSAAGLHMMSHPGYADDAVYQPIDYMYAKNFEIFVSCPNNYYC